jgi:hypothetical protein
VLVEIASIRYLSADPSSAALSRDSDSKLLFFRVAIVWRVLSYCLTLTAWMLLGCPIHSCALFFSFLRALSREITFLTTVIALYLTDLRLLISRDGLTNFRRLPVHLV